MLKISMCIARSVDTYTCFFFVLDQIRCCSNLNTIVARLSNRKKPGFLLSNSTGVQKLSWFSPSTGTTDSSIPKRDRKTLNESTNTGKRRKPNRGKGSGPNRNDHRGLRFV